MPTNTTLEIPTYQFLHFVLVGKKAKTEVWSCRNNKTGDQLGVVEWYAPWRQYCFFPTVQAVYSAGCLEDIAAFIKYLKGR